MGVGAGSLCVWEELDQLRTEQEQEQEQEQTLHVCGRSCTTMCGSRSRILGDGGEVLTSRARTGLWLLWGRWGDVQLELTVSKGLRTMGGC